MARRDRSNREYLYGLNPVFEALGGRRRCFTVWVREGRQEDIRTSRLLDLARRREVAVRAADPKRLDEMSQGGNHQGVVLETGPFPYVTLDELIDQGTGRTVLMLDRVLDPQNLATLIRTAVAVDAAGLVIQSDRSASITPAVVRSSAGLVEKTCVARVGSARGALDRLKDSGYWAIALEQAEGSVDLFETQALEPAALIVGSEASGVSRPVLKACDLIVHLPMPGPAESLNAAIAGSVALFELLRRSRVSQSRSDPLHE